MESRDPSDPIRNSSIQNRYEKVIDRLDISNGHFYQSDASPTGKAICQIGWVTCMGFFALAWKDAPIPAYALLVFCSISLAVVVTIADGKNKRKDST